MSHLSVSQVSSVVVAELIVDKRIKRAVIKHFGVWPVHVSVFDFAFARARRGSIILGWSFTLHLLLRLLKGVLIKFVGGSKVVLLELDCAVVVDYMSQVIAAAKHLGERHVQVHKSWVRHRHNLVLHAHRQHRVCACSNLQVNLRQLLTLHHLRCSLARFRPNHSRQFSNFFLAFRHDLAHKMVEFLLAINVHTA